MGESKPMNWQDAVATLTAERERAVAAAALIKRLGGARELTAAEIAYGDGRARYGPRRFSLDPVATEGAVGREHRPTASTSARCRGGSAAARASPRLARVAVAPVSPLPRSLRSSQQSKLDSGTRIKCSACFGYTRKTSSSTGGRLFGAD